MMRVGRRGVVLERLVVGVVVLLVGSLNPVGALHLMCLGALSRVSRRKRHVGPEAALEPSPGGALLVENVADVAAREVNLVGGRAVVEGGIGIADERPVANIGVADK